MACRAMPIAISTGATSDCAGWPHQACRWQSGVCFACASNNMPSAIINADRMPSTVRAFIIYCGNCPVIAPLHLLICQTLCRAS